jgi:hypothetical protein
MLVKTYALRHLCGPIVALAPTNGLPVLEATLDLDG